MQRAQQFTKAPFARVLRHKTTITLSTTPQPHPIRVFHVTPRTFRDPIPSPTPSPPSQSPTIPFSLLTQIRTSPPFVRYTVYFGLGLMATVESTFWFNVLRAKFFPSTSLEQKKKNDEFLENIGDAIRGYRRVYVRNYGRYYGAYVWGVDYGGLDGM